LLEVGCGGGILSESLAVLGARVTAIDAAEESILVAREHAKRNALLRGTSKHKEEGEGSDDSARADGESGRLTYLATTAEALQESLEEKELYDVVVSSEVIEHVVDPPAFCETLASLVKPGGMAILSTLNRTAWSYSLAIVAAEEVLGMAPKGAHEWDKFVTPEEMSIMCRDAGLSLEAISGMKWNIPKMQFELSEDKSINYIAAFTKPQ
jgi:ubiquinone biosynthesis O-methyltransferase